MKDNTTINDQISIIVKDEIQRQPTPIRCTITKIYDDNYVDILTNNNNILQYVETLGTPSLNSLGILFFFNRDFNDYIVLCNVNIDIVEDYMKTRNYFYKKIAEKLNNKTYDKPYTDYYYITEILKAYEIEYSSNYTIGKLLHDFSEAVTSNTYDECLTDEYYLKTIADYLTSADNGYKTSIYYLKLIYENIDSKKTSVLTVTSPVNNGSYGSELIVSGTLLSNDSEALSSKSILVKEGDTLLTTLTTDSDGVFDGIVSGLIFGYHTLSILFEEDSYCTGSSASRSISVVVPSSMTLTSDKSVLSYKDSESASLTATVLDNNGDPMSGQTVIMSVYNSSDDSLVESLSVSDNNDGTYTATYTSNGVGDVYIKAECNLLIQTYSIRDIYFNDDATSISKSSYYDLSNAFGVQNASKGNPSISNNGTAYTITGTQSGTYVCVPLTILPNVPFKMSYKTSTNDIGIFGTNNNIVSLFNKVSNYCRRVDCYKSQIGKWDVVGRADNIVSSGAEYTHELTVDNGNLTYKVYDTNGNQVYTNSMTSNYTIFGLIVYNSLTFTDVEIELL